MRRGMREEPRDSLGWIPARVSVRRDSMITKDPHGHSTKTLRQKQCLRDLGGTAAVICVQNPEYRDFIPPPPQPRLAPAGPRRGRALEVHKLCKCPAASCDGGGGSSCGDRATARLEAGWGYQGTSVPSQEKNSPVGPSSGIRARRTAPAPASAGSPPTAAARALRSVRRTPGASAFTLMPSAASDRA